MRKYKNILQGIYYPANKNFIHKLGICFIMIVLNVIQPTTAFAGEITGEYNTQNLNIQDNNSNNSSNRLYEGGELHAFYPSNAIFSEQMKQYIDAVDSLSFAWSRIDAADPGYLNDLKGKNGNTSFYHTQDYLLPVQYAKSKGKSIQLNIYMSGNDCTELLPYEDKQSLMLQAIIDYIQKDITQGEEIYFDGVVIDFEGLRNTDDNNTPLMYGGKQISTYYTEFLTNLKQQLELQGKKLYVAVNPLLYYDGYNYKEILGVADRLILMAHDYEPSERLSKEQIEQYTGFDALEPINSPAPIQMVRQALNDIQSAASDASDLSKVWLQIAFDSAQWQFNVNGAEDWEGLASSSLSIKGRLTPLYKSIKARVDNKDGYGQSITNGYNNELQSPYIQYYNLKDKTWNVILYEDSNSIGAKLDLAKAYGLGGISIWSLGNLPDYNDSKGKELHLDGWSTIIAKMNLPYTEPADSKKKVSFTDKIIEQTIREKLGKLTGTISLYDLKGIYRLKLPSGVKSLSDMDNLLNLEYLDAQQLNVKDITAIKKLTDLRVLYLQRNQITDLKPIRSLTHLEVLSLNGNRISSLLPLSALTQLRELYLSENKITDITPLSKLLKLRILNIKSNGIQNIDSLSGLKNLYQLYLDSNKISVIKGLKALTKLKELSLANNNISDIQTLKKLTNLEYLYLQRNSLSDIKSLSGLKNLKELSLNGNLISDIKPLAGLIKLEKLYITENKLASITPLTNLKTLQVLSLDKNRISDIKPLAGLTNLRELYLPENKVVDISSLKGLKNLKVLSLNRNSISELDPLAKLITLEKLYIKDNKIITISPLKELINLQELYLDGNGISDYSPVREMFHKVNFRCDFTLK